MNTVKPHRASSANFPTSARKTHRMSRLCRAVALACTAAALSLFAPMAAANLEEDNLLLLDVVLDKQRLASSITAYGFNNTAVVSLAEFGAALEFPIDVNAATGQASGWFMSPVRLFKLNLQEGYVEVEGKRSTFTKDEVIPHQDGIFVTLAKLSSWFPVDLKFESRSLSIEVTPREKLPAQIRLERRRASNQSAGIGPATLPLIETPHKLIGPHAADVGVGYSIRRNTRTNEATTGGNYSALLSGDLAFMDSKIYLSGNNDEALTDLRASLSRDNLNAPLGLRYIEVGDIVPAIVPGMENTSGIELGVLVQGGGSVTGRDDLITADTIQISGDALQGWDVELFQDGMRIGFQTIGPDGRYNFTNIEPISGQNDFELVFYGPAGEQRTETITRYSGLSPDQPGSVRYQFSASTKDEQLYESDFNQATSLDQSDPGSARLGAGLEVRVLPMLALRGSWSSMMLDGERVNYYGTGLRTGWGGATLTIDALEDPERGTRWDGSLQLPASLRVWGFDTRFTYTQNADSIVIPGREGEEEYDLQLNSRAGVTVSGPIGPVATRFSAFHNREDGGRTSTSYSAGFTARANRVTFGNTFNLYQFSRDDSGYLEPDRTTGNFFFSTRLHPLSIRGGINYELKPEAEARQYFIDSNMRVARDMSMTFGLDHNPFTGLTRYISGFNWQLPQVTLSPRLIYDSNDDFSGFVYASFSMAPRPDRGGVMFSGQSLATSGAVAGRVFNDNDGSGTFTEGDTPLPNVKVRAVQAGRVVETDENGVAYLTSLQTTRATDVVIEQSSLPDPQMASIHAGNSVNPRPTAIPVIDFPVVPTGAIEGKVFLDEAGRARRPLAGVMVELRDANDEVVDFKVTAYDGFYEFPTVPLAAYTVNLGGSRRASVTPVSVELNRERNNQTNVNLVLVAAAAPVRPLSQATPATPAPVPSPVTPIATLAPLSGQTAVRPAAPKAPSAAPAPAPAPVAQSPAKRPPKGKVVQLGAFSNAQQAQAHLRGLVARGALRNDQLEIVVADTGVRGVFHKVIAQPGGRSADALCASLKSQGVQCFTTTL